MEVSYRVIGHVKTSAIQEELDREESSGVLSRIVILKKYEPALDGIDGFSHLFVIFWLNRIQDQERKLKVHPKGNMGMPLYGSLATRTRWRPNPIGMTVVRLLSRKNNILKVMGLDALDGTPVIDLKPYDYLDCVRNLRVPEWWMKPIKPRL